LHRLNGVDEKVANSNLLLLDLRLRGWLHVDNGLDLGRSIGGRSDWGSLG